MAGAVGSPTITPAMCARGRTLAEARLAPGGSTVAFLATSDGRAGIVTVPVGGGPELVATADPPPPPSAAYGGGAFDWAGDGSLVYVSGAHLCVVDAGGGPVRRVVEGADAVAPAVSPDGGRVAYVSGGRHVAVASTAEAGPWPVRLSASPDFAFDPAWSPDGTLVAWHEWDVPAMPWDAGRIVVAPADGGAGRVTVAGGDGVSVAQPRFAPAPTRERGGTLLAFLSDAGGWLNLWLAERHDDGRWSTRPLVKEDAEHGEPSWGPGQRTFAWSPDGGRIAFTRNEGGFGRLCVVDMATGAVDDVAKGVHGALSWVGPHLVAVRSGARTPTEVVVYDTATAARAWQRRVLARGPVGGFGPHNLVEPELVSWPGDDGADVHGRLYRPFRPAGGLDRPPLLAWVHGGPTGQHRAEFQPQLAYWIDRGWAVLVADYRGSTGWGRAYTQALRGQWGELDVADAAAGMRAAAERGWCDPARMVPMGGSAGGFTVLLLLALHPELCAAGVDRFGVADLFELEETTHRFEAHYLQSIVGPLPDAADRYRERSPVNVAERIRSPLLILQGGADEVVPPAQSRAIADRLRALGRTVEHHEYEGEGHGWRRAGTVIDDLERVESFLRRHVLRRRP